MRIAGWFIEGFGVFSDFDIRLDPGLTVFLGPNEAGKSTLLGFLRAMLFGFPSRRSLSAQYPPLRGGRHGGRLIVETAHGEITIERFAGRKNGLLIDGREITQEGLSPLLGGADESLFTSVFAFSLSEMQSFAWLEAAEIHDRIFSAGIAGAGASARRVMDTLEANASALLRQRGSSVTRDLTMRIEQTEDRLRAAQAEAERYLQLEQEEARWRAQAAELSAEELRLLERKRAYELAIETWSECEEARRELASIEPVLSFPNQPEARFVIHRQTVDAARQALLKIEEERQNKLRLRESMVPDERLEGLAGRVEEFHGKLAAHSDRLETLAGIRSRSGRNTLWMALAVSIVFAQGWLVSRSVMGALVAAGISGLAVGAFLIFERRFRRAKILGLTKQIRDWEEPVREWIPSRGSAERLTQEFGDFRERCRKAQEVRAKRDAIDVSLADIEPRFSVARDELTRAQEALQSLLRDGGATDEADFQLRLRTFKRRQQLSDQIQEREARVTRPAGEPKQWPDELSRLVERVKIVRHERDDAVGAQRLADAERRRIAESAAIPTIQAELECLRSELAEAVREWRVTTLARELVADTLQEFTRTRQPAVLEEASGAFSRVTAGAYERIVQEEDRESLVLVDRQKRRKRPEELSRGAAEQLYLCLRFGLASEFARRSASLPLIMDDVLVNFDPERARAVARELAHFSIGRQILIFTCHPETAEMFADTTPDAKVIPLPRQPESPAKD